MAGSKLAAKTDLHPFHFRAQLPFGGDLDAAFSPREIVDWVERFSIFDRFVLGTHPPNFFRISTKFSQGEYLDACRKAIERVRLGFSGEVFSGIECDLVVGRGKFSFRPGEELLKRFNPDISIIGFHFHHSLTYGGLYDMKLSDVVSALRWALTCGLFNVISHPFEILSRIFTEDPSEFEKIANLALENRVAFEINADKGFFEKPLKKLAKNGNFFSFGGDLHALSYWLKRDWEGLEVPDEDIFLLERVLGLTRDVADKEKAYWREMDPMFRELPYASYKRWALRRNLIRLYKSCLEPDVFGQELDKIVAIFGRLEGGVVESHVKELNSIYKRWEGEPKKKDRMRAERYFLQVPLTSNEIEIYAQWLDRAFELGLKKEQLINTWDTPELKNFLKL